MPVALKLRLGSKAPDVSGFVSAAAKRGMPLTIVDLPQENLRDLYQADLTLIRPDQIVAWRGQRAPEDIHALLATVTGGAA